MLVWYLAGTGVAAIILHYTFFFGRGRMYEVTSSLVENMVLGWFSSDPLYKDYVVEQTIGKGTYGIVRKCRHRRSGRFYACKTLYKNQLPNWDVVQREIDNLKVLQRSFDYDNMHHLLQLQEVYHTSTLVHIVTNLSTGGTLYDCLTKPKVLAQITNREDVAAQWMHQLIWAIAVLHQYGMAHRDIKPENFLMLVPVEMADLEDAQWQLIDFGLSSRAPYRNERMKTKLGTVYYVAPEVIVAEDYDERCDCWGLGVIAHFLLTGKHPFVAATEQESLKLVTNTAPIDWNHNRWKNVSSEAIQFSQSLLTPDPTKRATAAQALQDAWIRQYNPGRSFSVSKAATSSETTIHPEPSPSTRRVSRSLTDTAMTRDRTPFWSRPGGTHSDLEVIESSDDENEEPKHVGGSTEKVQFADGPQANISTDQAPVVKVPIKEEAQPKEENGENQEVNHVELETAPTNDASEEEHSDPKGASSLDDASTNIAQLNTEKDGALATPPVVVVHVEDPALSTTHSVEGNPNTDAEPATAPKKTGGQNGTTSEDRIQ